jgi:hypothetical protein
MTDTNTPNPLEDDETTGVGVKRPDQGSSTPGQDPAAPASGGEGAAGAGGPDGFGTGT